MLNVYLNVRSSTHMFATYPALSIAFNIMYSEN